MKVKAHPVRCLGCGYEYELPRGRGSVVQARVCPSCSYAGWEPLAKAHPRVPLSGSARKPDRARARAL